MSDTQSAIDKLRELSKSNKKNVTELIKIPISLKPIIKYSILDKAKEDKGNDI